jgi:hypothetical protein
VGAWVFEQYADGVDIAVAFAGARRAAADEHGHGGYSGTIAEKDDYVVITHQLMSLDEAHQLARGLIDRQDRRINDKWGPAGAIPVRNSTVQADTAQTSRDGWLFFGWASS